MACHADPCHAPEVCECMQAVTQHPLATRHRLLHELVAEALQSGAAASAGSPAMQVST